MGAPPGDGGEHVQAFLQRRNFQIASVFDGCLNFRRRQFDAADSALNDARAWRVGHAAEVDGRLHVTVLDVVADAVHEHGVVLLCGADGEVALHENVDGDYRQHAQHNHNPAALFAQLKDAQLFFHDIEY